MKYEILTTVSVVCGFGFSKPKLRVSQNPENRKNRVLRNPISVLRNRNHLPKQLRKDIGFYF